MNELREFERHVEIFENDLKNYPEYIRKNIKFYLVDLEELDDIIKELESAYKEKFEFWCTQNIQLFLFLLENKYTFRVKIKGFIIVIMLSFWTNKMEDLNKIKIRYEFVRNRIKQISFFI